MSKQPSASVREASIAEIESGQATVGQIAKRLRLTPQAVRGWVRKKGAPPAPRPAAAPPTPPPAPAPAAIPTPMPTDPPRQIPPTPTVKVFTLPPAAKPPEPSPGAAPLVVKTGEIVPAGQQPTNVVPPPSATDRQCAIEVIAMLEQLHAGIFWPGMIFLSKAKVNPKVERLAVFSQDRKNALMPSAIGAGPELLEQLRANRKSSLGLLMLTFLGGEFLMFREMKDIAKEQRAAAPPPAPPATT